MFMETHLLSTEDEFYTKIGSLIDELNNKSSLKQILSWEADKYWLFKLKQENTLIGYGLVGDFSKGYQDRNCNYMIGTRYWLVSMEIMPTYQRQGYGKKLLNYVRNYIDQHLYVYTLRKAAPFYLKLGAFSISNDPEWFFEDNSYMIFPKTQVKSEEDLFQILRETYFDSINAYTTTQQIMKLLNNEDSD